MWLKYFLCNFKGNLWNSTQNILSIHRKIWFSYKIEILRALKNSYMFLKCWLSNNEIWLIHSWLTHWGRVTQIWIGKLTIIGSDNGLSPGRRHAIIWINARILLNGDLGTNFSEILIGIQTFSFKKIHLKMSSAKWRPFVSASMC